MTAIPIKLVAIIGNKTSNILNIASPFHRNVILMHLRGRTVFDRDQMEEIAPRSGMQSPDHSHSIVPGGLLV